MNKSLVSIIVAMDEKRGIGKRNNLLFKIPEDMKRMKALTTGHPLVMGRKTFESLGRLLPNRTHIVVTRDPRSLDYLPYKPHYTAVTIKEGIKLGIKFEAERLSKQINPPQPPFNKRGRDGILQREQGEVFIFGGGQIYAEALKQNMVDRLYLTQVKGDYNADTFFPEYPEFTKIISREDRSDRDMNYSFLLLEK